MRKRLLAWLISLTLLCIAGAAAEALDLDSLMQDIEEVALSENYKDRDATDMICLQVDVYQGGVFYTGQRNVDLATVRIENLDALNGALGGHPVFYPSSYVDGLRVDFRSSRDFSETWACLTVEGGGQTNRLDPDMAGEHVLTGSVVWGELSADIEIRFQVVVTDPALNGMTGVPSAFCAAVGEPYVIRAQTDPADWAFGGMSAFLSVWQEDDEQEERVTVARDDSDPMKVTVSADKDGVYRLVAEMLVTDSAGDLIFGFDQVVTAYIGNVERPDNVSAIELSCASIETELFTGANSHVGDVEIENFMLLMDTFGGDMSVTSTSSGRLSLRVYPMGAIQSIYVIADNGARDNIPDDAAGEYDFTVTFTWGTLQAELPVHVKVKKYDGPELTGISGVPSYFTAEEQSKPYVLHVRPDPEDWAYEGLRLSSEILLDENGLTYGEIYRYDEPLDVGIAFGKAGLYQMIVCLVASDSAGREIFRVGQEVIACIGGIGTPDSTDRLVFLQDSVAGECYTGQSDVRLGAVELLNAGALANALGGQPTVTSVPAEAGCPLGVSGELSENMLRLWLTVDGQADQPVPRDWAGTHRLNATVAWGQLSASITVTVTVNVFDGPSLTGVTGVPDSFEAAVGEEKVIAVKPVPENWACEGFRLELFVDADAPVWSAMQLLFDREAMTVTLAFAKPGVYELEIGLAVLDRQYIEAARVSRRVTATIAPEGGELTIVEEQAVWRYSEDGCSIYINRPTILGGTAPYQIAYNLYEEQGTPGIYYYSNDEVTVMSTGHDSRYNVFIVVTDAAGATAQIDTGWFTITGHGDSLGELRFDRRELSWHRSEDGKSIFLDRPRVIGGVRPYRYAYNCYNNLGEAVNYYYSNDVMTAMTPGHNGRFNVFVVVTDAAGASVQQDTGWFDLTACDDGPLAVAEEVPVFEISEDGRSFYINRPSVSGGTGIYTFAYNCYDAESNPVNYYYSTEWRTAMTPGYAGRFCVFVVISDGRESVIIHTGWADLK